MAGHLIWRHEVSINPGRDVREAWLISLVFNRLADGLA
jgi:hypothetical protein